MGQPGRNLAWLAKHHFDKVRVASFVLCLAPALWLGAEWLADALGINPLNRLLHYTGRWALILLTMTLAVTPARRLSVFIAQAIHARYGKRVSDWNWLIRLRRQFGLYTFFYAGLHLLVYFCFDAGLAIGSMLDDALERPFIVVGLVAYALLVPLAATASQGAIRRLGGLWRPLHMLTYAIAILALAHFWMQAKVGDTSALPYTLVLAALLASRLPAWRLGELAAGAEVPER